LVALAEVLFNELGDSTMDELVEAKVGVGVEEEFRDENDVDTAVRLQSATIEVIVTVTVSVQEVAKTGAQNASIAAAISPNLADIWKGEIE
jgi:hypothetical protein